MLLLLNLYISTILPGLFTLKSIIYYAQLALVILFIIAVVDFGGIRFKIFEPGIFSILSVLLAAGFFFSSFVVNISTGSNLSAIAKVLTYPAIILIFFFYLGNKLYTYNESFKSYMTVLLFAGLFLSLIALVMLITGIGARTEYSFTTHGLFVHPNTASFIFIIAIPVALYMYYSNRIGLPSLLIILTVMTVALLFTYSRAGYIGVFSSVICFLFLRSKKKKTFLFLALIFILIAVSLLMDFIMAKQDSSYGRLLLALTAVNMIIESGSSILWGYGVVNGVELFRDEKAFFGSYEFVDDPHNFILLLGIQFGMVVTVLVIAIITFVYAKVFMLDKARLSNERLLNLYLSISISTGLLINNLFEDILVYPEYYIMPVFLMFFGYMYFSAKYNS